MFQRLFMIWSLLPLLLLTACGGPEIRHLRVVNSGYDEAEKATRVRLSFEVWDGDEQITDLKSDSFAVYEDGQPASNESLTDSQTVTIKPPVVLVLDTSYSMYVADAIGPLKRAAQTFVEGLRKKGFDVKLQVFAATPREVASPEQIPSEFAEGKGGERWTALYHAVNLAFTQHPAAVYVVFSDGADNYSHNYGVGDFIGIRGRVTGESKVVHVVAFGNVKNEKDRNGLDAYQALQEMAQNGSFHEAGGAEAFNSVFADVASRIRKPYFLDYLSPSLGGKHLLDLELSHPKGNDRKGPVAFLGTTTPAAADAVAQPAAVDESELAEADLACEQAIAMTTACDAERGAAYRKLIEASQTTPIGRKTAGVLCRSRVEQGTDCSAKRAAAAGTGGSGVTLSARVDDAKWNRGLLITEMVVGSNAHRAGLRPGDVVQAVNGARVGSASEWAQAHRDGGIGGNLKASVLRGGKTVELAWSLASCDGPNCSCGEALCWEKGEPAVPRVRLGLLIRGGVVEKVVPGPAQTAGIQAGDEIASVKGLPVKDVAGLVELLTQHGEASAVDVIVVRGGKDLKFSIVPLVDP